MKKCFLSGIHSYLIILALIFHVIMVQANDLGKLEYDGWILIVFIIIEFWIGSINMIYALILFKESTVIRKTKTLLEELYLNQ